jgi:hypothetical protein
VVEHLPKLQPSLKFHGIAKKDSTEKDVRISDIEAICMKIGVRMTLPDSDEPMPLNRLGLELEYFHDQICFV